LTNSLIPSLAVPLGLLFNAFRLLVRREDILSELPCGLIP